MSQFDDNEENIEQPTDIIIVDEVQEEETLPFLNHCRKILKRVVKGAKKGQEVFHSCVEENFQSLFLFYKATAGTASSTQEAMIENAPENEISSYENYLKRKRNSLSGDILRV